MPKYIIFLALFFVLFAKNSITAQQWNFLDKQPQPRAPATDPFRLTSRYYNRQTFREHTVWLVYVHSSESSSCMSFLPEFLELTRMITEIGLVNVGIVNAEKEPGLAKTAGFKSEPIVKILRGEQDSWHEIEYRGDLRAGVVFAFLRKYKATLMANGKLVVFLAENRPIFAGVDDTFFQDMISTFLYNLKENTERKGHVHSLTSRNFREKVIDSKRPWFIHFYDATDEACQLFSPAVAISALHLNGNVNIGAVDIRANPELADRYMAKGSAFFPVDRSQKEEQFEILNLPSSTSWEEIVTMMEDKIGSPSPLPTQINRVWRDQDIDLRHKVRREDHWPAVVTVLPRGCKKRCRNNTLSQLQKVADINRRLNWTWQWAEEGDLPVYEDRFYLGNAGYPATAILAWWRYNVPGVPSPAPFSKIIRMAYYGESLDPISEEVKVKVKEKEENQKFRSKRLEL